MDLGDIQSQRDAHSQYLRCNLKCHSTGNQVYWGLCPVTADALIVSACSCVWRLRTIASECAIEIVKLAHMWTGTHQRQSATVSFDVLSQYKRAHANLCPQLTQFTPQWKLLENHAARAAWSAVGRYSAACVQPPPPAPASAWMPM